MEPTTERENDMNKERRKQIEKALELIEQAKVIIEDCSSDEQDAFEAMTESLQQSERGLQSEQALNGLQEAEGAVDALIDSLRDAVS